MKWTVLYLGKQGSTCIQAISWKCQDSIIIYSKYIKLEKNKQKWATNFYKIDNILKLFETEIRKLKKQNRVNFLSRIKK